MVLDVQLLAGLVLHLWASPFTTEAFRDMARHHAQRGPPVLRRGASRSAWWSSLALAHVGRARLKTRADSGARHKHALIFFGLVAARHAAVHSVAGAAGRDDRSSEDSSSAP